MQKIKNILNDLKFFREFIGEKTYVYLLKSLLGGVFWFAIESGFVFVLQGFLFSLSLISKDKLFLPDWYPTGFSANLFILLSYGAARAVVFYFRNNFAVMTQQRFMHFQRVKILEYGLTYASSLSSKEILTTFTEVVTQSGAVVYYISLLLNTIVAGGALLAFGATLAPREMLLGVLLLLIGVFPIRNLGSEISKYGESLLSKWSSLGDTLLWGVRNHLLLKVYHQTNFEIKKGKDLLADYLLQYEKYAHRSSVISSVPLFIGILILCVVALVGNVFFQTAPMKLLSFLYIFVRLAQAASESNMTLSFIKLNLPSFKLLADWHRNHKAQYLNQSKVETCANERSIDSIHSLALRNVTFGYSNQKIILNDLTIDLKKGDVFLIKGESGSGKSTLLSLFLGLYKPNQGDVLLNGISMSKIPYQHINDLIGYVGPDFFLIPGTISDNLIYGLNKSSTVKEEQIWHALNLVGMKDFIRVLDKGLDTYISEFAEISTGQKQRISFARALLRFPDLLILDESTANLDPETEKDLIEKIMLEKEKRITIIVSHRNSFDEFATKKMSLN